MLRVLQLQASSGGVEEPAVAVYLIGNAINKLITIAKNSHEYN